MAERRMFAKTIIDSDAFLDMSVTARLLYYDLSMRADDEGFVNSPKKIMRMIGASEDDLRMLAARKFIIPFESGIVVIKHWKIHNYIRGDRLIPTKYADEREQLIFDENGAYTQAEIPELSQKDDMRKQAYAESSLPYSFTYKMRRAFDGDICPVCGVKMQTCYKNTTPSVQHNIPISSGGKHELENISIICLSCNTSIQNKPTGPLNNDKVIETWDKIVLCEKSGIDWFENPEKAFDSLLTVKCLTCGGQVTAQDRLGKNSKGKNIYIVPSEPVPYAEIIDYLNSKAGTKYKATSEKSQRCIKARFNEGFTLEDFKIVIDKKVEEWTGSDMEKYLRPETLFGPKFESYLNARIIKPQSKANQFTSHQSNEAPDFEALKKKIFVN